jgi:iron complex outermembrane receptor protein
LNPVELLDSYKDFTNTNKFFGSINTTWKITSKLKYQFLVGESSTSSRKSRKPVAYYGYSECCARFLEVQMLNVAKHLSISNRFNKTFEHTLNYNNDLSDNFNLDALVGIFLLHSRWKFSSGKVMIALKQI